MKLIIAGGTGLIGKALIEECLSAGDEVTVLSRRPRQVVLPARVGVRGWDGRTSSGWEDLLETAEAFVNLSGENIGAGRWTAERKERIRASRIESGQAIVKAFEKAACRPRVLLQSSAVGYYGVSDDRILDESAAPGSDYLAGLCVEWEGATQAVESQGVRRILIRTGIVLDAKEGALARMLLPFRFFVGGPLGSGKQWLSWIHLKDEVRAIRYLLGREDANGAYNLTAPNPATNAQFGRMLGVVLRRPYWAPVPGFALRLVLGEMSTLVLDGQRVMPRRLIDGGFTFQYATLQHALADTLK